LLESFSKRKSNFQFPKNVKKSGQMSLFVFSGGYQGIRYLLAFSRSSLFLLLSSGLTLALLLLLNNLLFIFFIFQFFSFSSSFSFISVFFLFFLFLYSFLAIYYWCLFFFIIFRFLNNFFKFNKSINWF